MEKIIYIEANGCLARALDAQRLYSYFKVNGYKVTRKPKKANYILFIGCAAAKEEEELTKSRIRELKKYNKEFILGGCISSINKEWCDKNIRSPEFSTSNLNQIDKIFKDFRVTLDKIPDANKGYRRYFVPFLKRNLLNIKFWRINSLWHLLRYFEYRIKKGYYIRISWGCTSNHCAYCAIWKAIGIYKSKPFELCLKEFKDGIEKGHRRIHLIADNSGAYGIDLGKTFPNLLNEMLATGAECEIHLEEVHLFWLIFYLEELTEIVKSGKIKSISCPFQSGSDRILGLMNRRYTVAQVVDALLKIKNASPSIKLYTDIIVGFPTESEEDFEDTLKTINTIRFNSIAYYPYDEKRDTPAASIFPKIGEDVIRARIIKLERFLAAHKIGGGMF